jgi:asparagine synthase (glutamine-hydrolysing)
MNFEHKHSHRCINPSFDRQYYKYGLDRLGEEHGKATLNLRQILNRDLFWLTNALRYTDRISAVCSIETRFPFFDHRLMEFAFGIPENLKIKNGWTKWLLRQAMKDVLPSEILFQTRKLGFPTPIKSWLLVNRDNIREMFSSRTVLSRQYLNTRFIIDNLDTLLNTEKSAWEMWLYINLELWLQVFFGNKQ